MHAASENFIPNEISSSIHIAKILVLNMYEPRHEKTCFLHMQKQRCRAAVLRTVQLISAFVFTSKIVQSLFYLNLKFQASSHLLPLYSLVCCSDLVGNPQERFLCDLAYIIKHAIVQSTVTMFNFSYAY